jgi:hypothetical protein
MIMTMNAFGKEGISLRLDSWLQERDLYLRSGGRGHRTAASNVALGWEVGGRTGSMSKPSIGALYDRALETGLVGSGSASMPWVIT